MLVPPMRHLDASRAWDEAPSINITYMLDEGLGDFQVVVEGGQVEGSEAIILGFVDVAAGREVL